MLTKKVIKILLILQIILWVSLPIVKLLSEVNVLMTLQANFLFWTFILNSIFLLIGVVNHSRTLHREAFKNYEYDIIKKTKKNETALVYTALMPLVLVSQGLLVSISMVNNIVDPMMQGLIHTEGTIFGLVATTLVLTTVTSLMIICLNRLLELENKIVWSNVTIRSSKSFLTSILKLQEIFSMLDTMLIKTFKKIWESTITVKVIGIKTQKLNLLYRSHDEGVYFTNPIF
ncbi:hypothetical protein [[Acholeplasma] multilocale]|uniref:hypothetical protein n=1 Tax=[Acholeplasma] multilocale TaxID=264638 RepID=UPI00047C3F18|nr:hypothetical protein [[Acholeplasma] multilocale]